MIAAVGETVEDVGKAVAWLGDEEVAIHDDCFVFRHSHEPEVRLVLSADSAVPRREGQARRANEGEDALSRRASRD